MPADPTKPAMPERSPARWRQDAQAWAQALRSAQMLGSVTLAPVVAERIAAMLEQAEPPASAIKEPERSRHA